MTTPSSREEGGGPLLSVTDLSTHFFVEEGTIKAVDGVSFTLDRGEILGIVGESGCGKSVMSMSLLRLVESPGLIVNGTVVFDGIDLLKLTESEFVKIRGSRIAMIFQQSRSSLNPVMSIGRQIGEVLRIHAGMTKPDRKRRAVELLELVGIPDPHRRVHQYAHQISGGMAQRVMIAIALAGGPDLLIADEPTTALDVTVQAEILELLRELNAAEGMAIILITHDLDVVSEIADRVAVMYAGQIVEDCDESDIHRRPLHPYTVGLMRSRSAMGSSNERLTSIPGVVPVPLDLPPGCRFAPRCEALLENDLSICSRIEPQPVIVQSGHRVRCWLYE